MQQYAYFWNENGKMIIFMEGVYIVDSYESVK